MVAVLAVSMIVWDKRHFYMGRNRQRLRSVAFFPNFAFFDTSNGRTGGPFESQYFLRRSWLAGQLYFGGTYSWRLLSFGSAIIAVCDASSR